MSGHSKRSTIKHKKAITDSKRAKVFSRLGKLVEMAARNGADPSLNPSLETALQKARSYNLPKDVIERAIKKGSGQIEGEQLQEVFYEAYGPGGVALYIKCITSNTNRSTADIRSILTKFNCSMGQPNSVSWQFQEKGVIFISGTVEKTKQKGNEVETILDLDIDQIEEDIMESEAIDYELIENNVRIIAAKENFISSIKYFEEKNYKISESDLEYIADNFKEIDEQDSSRLEKMLELFDDHDDVDNVYHNAA